MSRFQDVKAAHQAARKRYDGYYSQCAYFAGAFSRALLDYSGWPRELVAWERAGHGKVANVEDALVLDADTFWHVGLHLRLPDGTAAATDDVHVALRFKRTGDRYLLELFPAVEFDVREPTPEAFAPVLDALFDAIRVHFERGLELFLDNRAGKLHLPWHPPAPRRLEPPPAGAPRDAAAPGAPPPGPREGGGAPRG